MTQHFPTRQLRFFLTAPQPCPYLPGKEERKVFAHLPLSEGPAVNDALTAVGAGARETRLPAGCGAARLRVRAHPAGEYPSPGRNGDPAPERALSLHLVEAEATMEQCELLRRYLNTDTPTAE